MGVEWVEWGAKRRIGAAPELARRRNLRRPETGAAGGYESSNPVTHLPHLLPDQKEYLKSDSLPHVVR